MKILFVCTGNTCRSPMAEGIAKKLYPKFDFSSAGLYVNNNDKANINAIKTLKTKGIDISSHIAKQLNIDLIDDVDYIIPMTLSHKQMLLMLGASEDKILLFNEQIPDPFGQDTDVYKKCACQIEKNIEETIGELYDKNTK